MPKLKRAKLVSCMLLLSICMIAFNSSPSFGKSFFYSGQDSGQDKARLKDKSNSQQSQDRIRAYLMREVRHELLSLAYYDVFDWLQAEVNSNGRVVLRGQVTRPATKSDAERNVRDIEGVEQVINDIEVLPLSPNDDRIRRNIYYALFNSNSQLMRYGLQSVPPIHIIVKNGRVTLKGVVANDMDKQLAYTKAREVEGTFEVVNELQVEGGSR